MPPVSVFCVVPLVGTWIEIIDRLILGALYRVVPLVGTWIEICRIYKDADDTVCRPPRGDVD